MLAFAPVVAACDLSSPESSNDPSAAQSVFIIGGSRPATLVRPFDHATGTRLPVVIALHGYTSNASSTDRYFGLAQRVTRDRFALILPNGTRNPEGSNFWNATDYCCDFWGSGVDDVAYLNSLVTEAGEHVVVDGVYLIGLSNGAFMSYRMACESMPGLRGIVPVGGADFDDPARCEGARPLSVLHIHGTGDVVIGYHGGSSEAGTAYPAAEEAVRRWASRAGCDLGAAEMLEPLDLDFTLSGAETQPLRYRRGCRAGVTVELWTIEGGAHVPAFDPDDIGERILAWLLD